MRLRSRRWAIGSPASECMSTSGTLRHDSVIARAHPLKHPSHIDFSPDGSLLAVKNTSGDIAVLDALTLDVLARHHGRPWGEGSPLRFSSDGAQLVDGSWDGHLLVRDTMSGDVLYSEHDGTTMIVGIAATVDRSRWVVQSSTRSPHDAPNVVSIRQWPLSRDRVDVDLETGRNVVALHPSAMRLAIVTDRLRIWDVSDADRTTGSIVAQSPRFPISGTGNHVSWSPQGDRVALAGARAVRIFTPNAREVASIELEYASSVAYSPSGELLSHAALGAKDSSSRRQSSGDPLLRLSALPT